MGRARKEPDQSTYSGRLAKRIRELREAVGLTVEQVAARIAKGGYELSPHTLYAWEAGRRGVDWDALPALARALKIKRIPDLLPLK